MKNLFFFLLLTTFIVACNYDDDSIQSTIPDCVKVLFNNGPSQDTSLLMVRRQLQGNEYHYWLHTGNLAFDGPEYIVDEKCDTVCLFCFCPPRTKICQEDYDDEQWEIVWEK